MPEDIGIKQSEPSGFDPLLILLLGIIRIRRSEDTEKESIGASLYSVVKEIGHNFRSEHIIDEEEERHRRNYRQADYES